METERSATPEPWITAEEAAAHLGYAVGSLYNKLADGEPIPHRRIGNRLRFRRSELDAWIESQAGTPAPQPAA